MRAGESQVCEMERTDTWRTYRNEGAGEGETLKVCLSGDEWDREMRLWAIAAFGEKWGVVE